MHTRDHARPWLTAVPHVLRLSSTWFCPEHDPLQIVEAARAALRDVEVRASELRAQLADARLHALRLQLNPHFLFNVLNTIGMMIRARDSDRAQRMISLLGEMFRFILEREDEQTIFERRGSLGIRTRVRMAVLGARAFPVAWPHWSPATPVRETDTALSALRPTLPPLRGATSLPGRSVPDRVRRAFEVF